MVKISDDELLSSDKIDRVLRSQLTTGTSVYHPTALRVSPFTCAANPQVYAHGHATISLLLRQRRSQTGF